MSPYYICATLDLDDNLMCRSSENCVTNCQIPLSLHFHYTGAHSVGRVHCINLVNRLYPTVDSTMDPKYAEYLKGRCPTLDPDPKAVQYARNDRETPMVLDNNYHKHLLQHKGLLLVDQQLLSDPATSQFVQKMAEDNDYFRDRFAKNVLLLSENSPLTDDQGEIRKDCRFVNQ